MKLNLLPPNSKTSLYHAECNLPNKPIWLLKGILEEIIRPFVNPEVLSLLIDRNRMKVLLQLTTPGIVRHVLKTLRR